MNRTSVGGVEFLVTSYMLGGPDGHNLGAPGYSHEFVARLFKPLLARWGTVTDIRDPHRDLAKAVAACRSRGSIPVHFSVLPFQDVCLAEDAINVVMPAWEFPDLPDHPFDGNPQNDWPATANRADLVLVSGPFTAAAFTRAGTTVPVRIVPVPTPAAYSTIPAWQATATHRIGCKAYVFDSGVASTQTPHAMPSRAGRLKRWEKRISGLTRSLLGRRGYESVSNFLKRRRRASRHRTSRPDFADLPYHRTEDLDLSGVVYTSIFNPDDGRKNWQDLLTAALLALADHDDATIVFKLIARSSRSVRQVIDHYLGANIPHRCRIVFICDFLDDTQMQRLCEATTFYVQATRAEGNCLPLMNHLAAGRPGVSPRHSSMGDYFCAESGFVVASHPEPAAWPHDRSLRLRTTWGRIVWPSLKAQIAASYRLVTEHPDEYAALSARCRTRMRAWAGTEAVAARLTAALVQLGVWPSARDARPTLGPRAAHRTAA